ncbi:calcium-binding protein [Aliishimia ponticola]|uniref:Calcium-binding protein n=1 Tax=Aliishimia ponticola TaxID=2499833 RepID=A0A4S4NH81_9RHOB|nr:calcium-binding protein [Aliishimia ponticola]THH39034.1 calcium-binding protein [Aliishimia ponticola]
MADIQGTSIRIADTFNDIPASTLDGGIDAAFATVNGATFLYATGQTADGFSIFSVAADGSLTFLDSITDTGGTTLDNASDIVSFQVGGNQFIAVGGEFDDGVAVYALSDTPGYATFTDAVFDSEDPDYELNGTFSLAVMEYNDRAFVFAAGINDSGLSVLEVDGSGNISVIQNVPDDVNTALSIPRLGQIVDRGTGSFTLPVTGGSQGLSVFNVSSTGIVSLQTTFEDTSVLSGPAHPAGALIGNDEYYYVTDRNNDTTNVFVRDGFDLELIQSFRSNAVFSDNRDGQTFQFGDTWIYATSENSSGGTTSFYAIDSILGSPTAGHLSLIQTLTDGVDGDDLASIWFGDSITIDGTSFIVGSARLDDSLVMFEVGGGDDVLDGTQSADTIRGGSGDDVIHGLGGDDEIDGGNDDDIIYAGSGIDTVYASAGADRTFGGSNYDTFDAGFFNGAAGGVQIDTAFDLFRTPDGTKQLVSGFEKLLGTSQDDDIRGDDANNDLRGLSGNDVLNGRGGNDSLRGSNGDDRLLGADGNDFLFGGFGADDLRGGSGSDQLAGDAGDDFMLGDNGADTLNGGVGEDTMTGGNGADIFVFENYALGATEYDSVRDFTSGSDKLDLSDFGFANAAAVLAGATQRGWGVRLELDSDQVVALEGLNLADLSGADLIL